MNEIISRYFGEQKIEYFSVLDYRDLREIHTALAERVGFELKSAIVFLVPYYVSTPRNISSYASSLDYHLIIKRITDGLISVLKEAHPQYSFVGFGDHSPIDERHAALSGGLGILGDSGLLINEKYGTYVFIADVLSDMPPELLGATAPRPHLTCSHCGACRAACPTGILRGEGDDCLSAITQRKGELAEEELDLMRKFDTVWGCDLCQRACPHNRTPLKTPVSFFYEKRVELLTSELLASLSKSELSDYAFGWRGRAVLRRNLEALEY